MSRALFWLGIVLLVFVVVYQMTNAKKSCYAPPRDENTILPYVENFLAALPDSQMDVYKDAGGTLNQREHPLTDNFQSNAYAGTNMGSFVSLESSSGNTPMTVIPEGEQYTYSNVSSQQTEYIPNITSEQIPFLGSSLRTSTASAPLES